jgi:hypothetical protein
MDQDQLAKAATEGTELEYLFDNDQWLPAIVSHYQIGSSHSPHITIQLLQHPRNHSGTIHLNANDIEHRLRSKGSN